MMNFMIHYPVLTTERTDPKVYKLDATSEGFLAHFRGDNTPKVDQPWHESYSGLVRNEYTERATFLDDEFVTKHRYSDVSALHQVQ